ncbi:hypothetical protein JY651_44805 [Pyxidicoccus parkwayensis]|uniref:Uncharacterized protein n=1 Tax=Pyxidicoccus parkwayensis TaxID=2813578 RepID=A0ABX7NXG5_9BACT|nr:hypothetical protein [Pyxidicoccus parkwaysis]QSQ22177.1 hypothetical protein JY651_44805 [Pyxidicoccus parkwaysis]
MPVRDGGRLLLACLVLLSLPAAAQDAHYWNRQFGNRAWMLGGALLGNPGDISSVYYNPGALSLVKSPRLELTGNVFEYSRLTVVDGLGAGKDLSTSSFSALPALLAGPLDFHFLGRARMAYSLLTRQGFDTRLSRQDLFQGTDLVGIPGLQSLSSSVRVEHEVHEFWAGLTWSLPLGGHLGVGLTPFIAFRQQRASFLSVSQGGGASGQSLDATFQRDYQLKHIRLLAKLGASYQEETWAVGLTVTTPSVGLAGSGEAGFERAVSQQGFNLSIPSRVSDLQKSAPVQFKSPLSVGVGGNRVFGATILHAAVEAFARVHTFRLVDTEPIVTSDSAEVLDGDIFHGFEPVVNVAVGVEHDLGRDVRVYLSAHTDFDAAESMPDAGSLLSDWDLYHAATGVYFPVARHARFMVGTDLAWGRRSTSRFADILAESGLPPTSGTQHLRVFQATLVLGASLGGGEPVTEPP